MLAPGTQLGPFEIQSLLGSGGMGEVYRARDSRLDRTVAIKIIPASFSSGLIRRQRFQREARAISALQHPNICTLYDVGQQDGTDYLVMEYLEGETLGARLAKMRLSIEQVLAYGIEIANALDAAHARGIVHRDLKPGNIFLTSRGDCKVLDFGLAQMETDVSPEAPTLTQMDLVTSPGAAVGTVAYMSPEQARGETLDHRTDIFSLGSVLYEMATGNLAFPGKTSAIVFKAILDQTPPHPSELNKSLPDRLDEAIGKCLEKDRELRYQSATELRADLKRIKRDSESQRFSTGAMKSSGTRSITKSKWIFAGAVVIFMVLAPVWGAYHWLKPRLAQHAFQHYRISRLTSTGNVDQMTISRDGRYLTYVVIEAAGNSLWVQQIATATNVRILGPVSADLNVPTFSPDGNYIYYLRYDGNKNLSEIYRLPAVGGSPVKIISDGGGFSISPDGLSIAFRRKNLKAEPAEFDLILAEVNGSNERKILTVKGPEYMWVLNWSPDGRTIIVGIDERGQGNINALATVSANGGPEHRFLHHTMVFGMDWLPDGSGLVLSSPGLESTEGENSYAPFQLWVFSFREANLRRLTNDLSEYMDVSLTADGKSLGTPQKQMSSSIWIAPAANPTQAKEISGAGRMDGVRGLAWLPDGRLLYMGSETAPQIWQMDRDGNHRQQLTHLPRSCQDPSATADGTTLWFSYANNIWRMDADGSNARQVTTSKNSAWNAEVSPDGKWLTYHTREGPSKVASDGGRPELLTPNEAGYATISPDGQWIAFESWDKKSPQSVIEVVAADSGISRRFLPFLPNSEDPVPAASNMGILPIRWTPSGDALTFVRTKDGVSNLWSQPIDGRPARQITNFTSGLIWRHAWSRDGRYLAFARGNLSIDAVMLTDTR